MTYATQTSSAPPRRLIVQLILGVLLLLLGVSGLVWLLTRPSLPGEALHTSLPALTLPDAAGVPVNLADLRGQPFLLNFWATWCPPCDAEMPALQELHDQPGAAGLRVIAVNMQETPDTVVTYLASKGLSFPVLLDAEGALAAQLDVTYLPTTFFVDAEGIIRGRVRRALTVEEMQQAAAALNR